MIRLLMGITMSETGGSQKMVYNILSGLPQEEYEVTLLTSPGGSLLDWVEDLNRGRTIKIKVLTCPHIRRDISLLSDVRAFLYMLTLFAKKRYDVAHFHNSKMGLLGRLAAKLAGVPRILYTVHGWGLNRKTAGRMYFILDRVERLLAKRTDAIIFVCESDMRTGIANRWASEANSVVIYNGVPQEAGRQPVRGSLGIPADVPLIAYVARLAQPKEPAFAIRVCERLAAQGHDHRMVIIGGGPKQEECSRLIEELHLENRVYMLGHRENACAILKDADIFCLFSRWEGLPVSILEAMCAGLPVVANGVGGIPELVANGETGFLVDGLDLDAAAEALAALVGDSALRRAMGAAARQAAMEKFMLGPMVCGYRRLYEQRPSDVLLRGTYGTDQI